MATEDSYMSYVNRESIAGNNPQMLTTYEWDFKINKNSTYDQVYYPGDLVTKARIRSIQGIPVFPEYQGNLSTDIRGFKIIQPGFNPNYGGTVNLEIQDFEDQSMTAWIMDWLWKCNNPANHASFHKKQLAWDSLELIRLNNFRKPVFKSTLYTILPAGGSGGNHMDFANEKTAIGGISLSLDYEYYENEFLNT